MDIHFATCSRTHTRAHIHAHVCVCVRTHLLAHSQANKKHNQIDFIQIKYQLSIPKSIVKTLHYATVKLSIRHLGMITFFEFEPLKRLNCISSKKTSIMAH